MLVYVCVYVCIFIVYQLSTINWESCLLFTLSGNTALETNASNMSIF